MSSPEENFLEGVSRAVYRRTGKNPWMDQVEEDFLPLLAEFKAPTLRKAAENWRRFTAGGKCPTCEMVGRETVGMVCQTCGTDYGKSAL